MQQKTSRRDQAITAFFLDAGQAGQIFVRDVFSQACLAERLAFH